MRIGGLCGMTGLRDRLGGRRFGLGLKLAVTLLLVAYLAHSVDAAAVVAQLGRIGPGAGALCLGLYLFQAVVLSYRWHRILGAAGVVLTFRQTLRIVLIGLFFNQCLPTSLGGDGVRILLLRRPEVSLERAVNLVLVDRLSGLMGLIPLLLGGLPFLLSWRSDPLFAATDLGVTLLFCIALVIYFLGDGLVGRAGRWSRLRVLQAIAAASAFARRVAWYGKGAGGTFALALVVHGLTVGVVLVLARALGASLSLGEGLVLAPPVIAAAMLPISFGGWGTREVVMVIALGTAGVAPATALAVSILLGFLALVATAPGAALWLAGRTSGQEEGQSLAGPRACAARAGLRRPP